MAASDQLQLAQRQRREQLSLRARFLREFVAAWPVLDKANIGGTSPDWLRVVTSLIHRWRTTSAESAQRYYRVAHTIGTHEPIGDVPLADHIDDEQIIRNLLYTGPGEIKRARLLGLTQLEAEDRALEAASGASGRLVLGGGRDTLHEAGRQDRLTVGWMRVTDDDPCYFCALMTTRGAVYKNELTAGADADTRFIGEGIHKFHDHCGCTAVPLFERDAQTPEIAQRYEDIYRRVAAGKSGREARLAFRRAIEGRQTA